MPKRSAFVMFMEDRRASVLQTGAVLSRGLADLALLLSDDWRDLPEDEKDKYVERAERFNSKKPGYKPVPPEKPKVVSIPRPTPPKPIPVIPKLATHNDQIAFNEKLLLELFRSGEWIFHPIVVCSFTTYFEHDYGQIYFPAEIGLATFSITDGVVDNFGRVIDPGNPPTGYGVDVVNSIEVLGLTYPGLGSEFSNLESLMLTLQSYLEKYRGGFRTDEFCVFALDCEFEQVSGCFEWLNKNTGYSCPVRVMSLSNFTYLASAYSSGGLRNPKLQDGEDDPTPCAAISEYRTARKPLNDCFCYPSTYPLAKYGIFLDATEPEDIINNSDNYKYYDELCCIYHFKKGKGIQFCALNKSNRYAFSVLEFLTLSNEVEISPGHHFPQVEKRETEIQRRQNWLIKWGITALEMEMEDPPELATTITQVQPLHPRRPRAERDETGMLEASDRNPGNDGVHDPENGLQNSEGYEGQPRRDNVRSYQSDSDNVLEFAPGSGRRPAIGRRNPFLGIAPRVFQRHASAGDSSEFEGATDGN